MALKLNPPRAVLWLLPFSFALCLNAAHAAQDEEDGAEQQKMTEQYIQSAFDAVDVNKDSKIDREEFRAYLMKFLMRQKAVFDRDFAKADTNHDGKLSREEVQVANPLLAKYFDAVDENKDGFLTKREIRNAIREYQLRVSLHGGEAEAGQSAEEAGVAKKEALEESKPVVKE